MKRGFQTRKAEMGLAKMLGRPGRALIEQTFREWASRLALEVAGQLGVTTQNV